MRDCINNDAKGSALEIVHLKITTMCIGMRSRGDELGGACFSL